MKNNNKQTCELCESPANTYCDSDRAKLCWGCDSKVHQANFLVTKHSRTLLCHICQNPTPWTASGPLLSPCLSLCLSCSSNSNRVMGLSQSSHNQHQHHHHDGHHDDGDHDDSYDDDDMEEEEEVSASYSGSDDDEDDDDEDNQVVPLTADDLTVSSTCIGGDDDHDHDDGGGVHDHDHDDGPRGSMVGPSSLKRKRQFYLHS